MGVPSTHAAVKQKSKKSNIQRAEQGGNAMSSAASTSDSDHGDNLHPTNAYAAPTAAPGNITATATNTMGTLVGKMTDLVLGDMNTQQSQPQTPTNMQQPKTQPSDEDDWEKAWAEDSESDEEEEVVSTTATSAPPPTAAQGSLRLDATSPVGHTVSSNLRPDLDSGHGTTGMGMNLGADVDVERHLLQQQKQEQQKHDRLSRAVSPEEQFIQDEKIDQTNEEWEGYHHEIHADTETERPCVNMFDPALRVLGRGSFGRVSKSCAHSIYIQIHTLCSLC